MCNALFFFCAFFGQTTITAGVRSLKSYTSTVRIFFTGSENGKSLETLVFYGFFPSVETIENSFLHVRYTPLSTACLLDFAAFLVVPFSWRPSSAIDFFEIKFDVGSACSIPLQYWSVSTKFHSIQTILTRLLSALKAYSLPSLQGINTLLIRINTVSDRKG